MATSYHTLVALDQDLWIQNADNGFSVMRVIQKKHPVVVPEQTPTSVFYRGHYYDIPMDGQGDFYIAFSDKFSIPVPYVKRVPLVGVHRRNLFA